MPIQIQLRRGSAAEWTSANPVLAAGEVGLELDTTKIKIGDGSLSWNSLSYFSSGSAGSSNYTASAGTSASLNNIPANLYALLSSSNFTSASISGSAIATQAFVTSQGYLTSASATGNSASLGGIPAASYALLSSPSFSGSPVVPTAAAGASTTQIANTLFIKNELSNLDRTTINVSQYAGYDSSDGTVAMSAWMQAYYDASRNRQPLLIPQKPGALGSKWTLTGGVTTSSTALSASSGNDFAITVTNSSMFPASGSFVIILDALSLSEGNFTRTSPAPLDPTTSAGAEWVTVNSRSGNTLFLAARSAGPLLSQGKIHTGTYTIVRALPFLDNLKIRGLFPAGSEGQPVAVAVTNSSYSIECPYYWGGGSDNSVDGAEIEDIAHWAHQSNYDAATRRALFLDGSISQLTDCRFNRCHFKHFTQIDLVCSRVQLTNLYINNGYTVNRSGINLITSTAEGYLELGGSDNVMRNVFLDTSNYVPSDRSLVRCRWSDSVIDYLYITPAPARAIEFTGWISGLQIPNLIINGLNTHAPISGLAANRPSGASAILGLNYYSTDTGVVERYNSASTWVQVTASTTLLPTQSDVATLTANYPPATTGLRRWALVSDTTLDGTAKAFYSDGVRWRGPMRSSTGALQYLGGDYGILFNNVNGSIAIGNLHMRQVAEFDTDTGQAGAIKIQNTNNSVATILIANLQLEQSYGTDLNVVTSGRSNLIISNAVKDFTMTPNLTTTGSGNTILLYNFAANSASLGGIGANAYALLASANFTAASVGGAAVATQPYVNSLGFLTSSGSISTASNSASLGGVAASAYALLASPTLTGAPLAPTVAASVNNTQIATTAFVRNITSTASLVNSGSLGGIAASAYVSSSVSASIGNVPTWNGTNWAPTSRNKFRPGTWTYHDGTGFTTTPFTINQLNIAPVITGGNSIQALTLHAAVTGVATSSVRVVVYSDGPDGYPTTLTGSALFDTSSAGQYTSSGLNIPGSPTGRHWIGTVGHGASSASAYVWAGRIAGAPVGTLSASTGTPFTSGLRFQWSSSTVPLDLSASVATNATYVGVVAVQLS